jgi:hypothetical protein
MTWSPRKLSGSKHNMETESTIANDICSREPSNIQTLHQDLNSLPSDNEEARIDLYQHLPANVTRENLLELTDLGGSSCSSTQPILEVTRIGIQTPNLSFPINLTLALQQPARVNELPTLGIIMPTARGFEREPPPFSSQENRLLVGLDNPSPLQLSPRDPNGLDGVYSMPRLGRVTRKLQDHSSKYRAGVWRTATPYGDGVQRTRREIDYRVPREVPGVHTLIRIPESPQWELSPTRTLPWAE